MTEASFLAFYPRFSSFSRGVVLAEYLRQANARFSDFGEDAEEARGLYTAHKLTLYCAGSPPGEEPAAAGAEFRPTMAQLAAAGRGAMREMASKKVGEVSVTYSSSASAAASAATALSDLKETVFGLQLLSLLRLYGLPAYIP